VIAVKPRMRRPFHGDITAVHTSIMKEFGGDACGMGYTYLITDSGAERLSKLDLARDLLGNEP
jgi:hypothetical protein